MFSAVATTNETLLAKCLKALADELCLKILHALGDGPAACTELARRFQCDRQVIRRRLEELRKVGFVQRQARSGYTGKALYVACIEKIKALFAAALSYTGLTQESPV